MATAANMDVSKLVHVTVSPCIYYYNDITSCVPVTTTAYALAWADELARPELKSRNLESYYGV